MDGIQCRHWGKADAEPVPFRRAEDRLALAELELKFLRQENPTPTAHEAHLVKLLDQYEKELEAIGGAGAIERFRRRQQLSKAGEHEAMFQLMDECHRLAVVR